MFKKLLTGAVLLAASATANAGVISQLFWFGDDTATAANELAITTGVGGGATIEELELDWGPATFSFDLFDTLGGTRVLNSVELILNGTSTGEIEGTNGGTNPADLTLELGAQLSVSTSGVNLVTVFPQYAETFLAVGSGAIVGSGPVSTSSSNSETYTSSDTGLAAFIFSQFLGTGTSTVDIEAEGQFNASGGGSGSVSRVNSSEGALEIIYNYTDLTTVPEPGYLALIGLFLVMFSKRVRLK